MDDQTVRTVILTSGAGSNLQAVVDTRFFGGIPNMKIVAVLTDSASCLAAERSRLASLPVSVIEREIFASERSFAKAIGDELDDLDTELIVVADWKFALPQEVIRRWSRRILCLLPARLSANGDAADYPGESMMPAHRNAKGVIAYLLEADGTIGPVLRQKEVKVSAEDSPAEILAKIAEIGRAILPEAIAMYCSGRLCFRGRQARMLPPM